MYPALLLLLVFSSAFSAAAPSLQKDLLERWGSYEVYEKRLSSPNTWSRAGKASRHETLPLRIALKQRNLEHADRYLYDVSDPDSPNYAQHWTASRVASTFASKDETIEQALAWLQDYGIASNKIRLSNGRNWITVDATVTEAERLLRAEFHVFKRDDSGDGRIACDAYSLPKKMKEHIDFIMPTIHLDGLQPLRRHSPKVLQRRGNPTETLSGTKYCKRYYITIDCMRAAYNFGKGNYSLGTLGIMEESNYLDQSDLDIFFHNWTRPTIPSGTFPEFISIDGGKTLAESGSVKTFESALDFQIGYSIAYPQKLSLYQVGDGVNVDGSGSFNIFLDALDGSYCTYQGGDAPYLDPQYPDPNEGGFNGTLQCGGAPLTDVISISYGQIEAALPVFYQQRQCHEWMKLALQGVSVLFSSGDSGVANAYNSNLNHTCVNTEHGYLDVHGKGFSPGFPVNCPYVTAVGATYLKTNNIHGGETGAFSPGDIPLNDFSSGGGFSNVFARPSYQNGPVMNYLNNSAPAYAANVYNRTGRGFPDVSAFGLNIATVHGGYTNGGGGTSASAPLFASVISLINAERLHAGKTAVGFLNPTMYKHPDMFNDVTAGSNPGCGTKGFTAVEGWDPVTGLGTPNYEKMKAVWMSLP